MMIIWLLHLLFFQCHFTQHLLKEQERFGQEVEEEVEMRMRKAERQEESYTELLHSTETNMQVSETFDICQHMILMHFLLALQETVKSHKVIQTGMCDLTPLVSVSLHGHRPWRSPWRRCASWAWSQTGKGRWQSACSGPMPSRRWRGRNWQSFTGKPLQKRTDWLTPWEMWQEERWDSNNKSVFVNTLVYIMCWLVCYMWNYYDIFNGLFCFI